MLRLLTRHGGSGPSLCTKVAQRSLSYVANRDKLQSGYDAIVIGAGHNGLVAAAYLQKSGLNVCVLERRHLIGGAAVTEEIVPGFKFSRASYLLSLLRPQVVDELELKKHGLKLYFRQPNSYTPLHESFWKKGGPKSLTTGGNEELTRAQISQFSSKDAEAYFEYERLLNAIIAAMGPILDTEPADINIWEERHKVPLKRIRDNWKAIQTFSSSILKLGKNTTAFYELLTAPASKILDRWFESEPLKAALATDSVIGAMISPHTPGSGYVLLHHVMGELEGRKGAWAYVEGGMGSVSAAIAKSAASYGASIFTDVPVARVCVDNNKRVTGVVLKDGSEVKAPLVLSNATPKVTFLDLVAKENLPEEFVKEVQLIDYASPTTKINVAVNKLPNFVADPNTSTSPLPHHQCTVHLNTENVALVHAGYVDALAGRWSTKPMIEMTIPSVLDPTLAPAGCHVVQLFTQYTPYTLAGDRVWNEQTTNEYADHVFNSIESYAPGFKASVVGRDILTPPEIERIFGITGGNIFHGALSLDQLYSLRPVPSYSMYRTPLHGFYLCGSGAHPGGGVTGGPGRLAALRALKDLKRLKQMK